MKLHIILLSILIITSCTRTSKPSNQPINNEQSTQIEEQFPELSIMDLSKKTYSTTINISKPHVVSTNFTSSILNYQSENLTVNALINIPNGPKPQNGFPVVIVNHGYIPPDQYSTKKSYINTSAYFANNGFILLKPDYRGHDSSQGTPNGIFSRSEYAIDVLNLISGINQIKEADVNNIFLYGHSMGGEVSLIILEVNPNIKAASLWAPATTYFPENALYFAKKNTDPERENNLRAQLQLIKKADYFLFGSWEYYDRIKIPINLHHGTNDESVPYQWAIELNKKLSQAGVQVNFYTYPQDTHDIPNNWTTALNRDLELFKSKMN